MYIPFTFPIKYNKRYASDTYSKYQNILACLRSKVIARYS